MEVVCYVCIYVQLWVECVYCVDILVWCGIGYFYVGVIFVGYYVGGGIGGFQQVGVFFVVGLVQVGGECEFVGDVIVDLVEIGL